MMRLTRFLATTSASVLAAGFLVAAPAAAQAAPSAPAAPAVGECLNLPSNARWYDPFAVGDPADCAGPHNSEVFHIGTYPDSLGAPSTETEAIDGMSFYNQMCPFQAFNAWLEAGGITPPTIGTRLYWKPAPPSDEAWAAGDRSVQCIVYAISGKLGKEKPTAWSGTIPQRVKADGWRDFALCSKGVPPSGVDRSPYACTKASMWIAVNRVFDLTGTPGRPFPGAEVQGRADRACAKAVKRFSKGRPDVVAAVEPKALWDEGIREAVCYIPLAKWNGKAA